MGQDHTEKAVNFNWSIGAKALEPEWYRILRIDTDIWYRFFFPHSDTQNKQNFLTKLVCSCLFICLCSTGCCVCAIPDKHAAKTEVADCLVVNEQLNTDNMMEWCFSCLFLIF